jgi:hypothetical protein
VFTLAHFGTLPSDEAAGLIHCVVNRWLGGSCVQSARMPLPWHHLRCQLNSFQSMIVSRLLVLHGFTCLLHDGPTGQLRAGMMAIQEVKGRPVNSDSRN